MTEQPLNHCTIVITRPAAQAETLSEGIRDAGGQVILFPLLAIAPLEDYRQCDAIFDTLEAKDSVIFISSNAVQHGLPRLLARCPAIAHQLSYIAIGPATAAEIRHYIDAKVLTPSERYDSESLLALPEMQEVAGRKFVIVRGMGGRDLLADTLRSRGAVIRFAECYRRINPQRDTGDLPHLWQNERIQAIVITSSEAMRNLIGLGSGATWLGEIPIFVNHARIATLAQQHGLRAVLADAPGDEAMLRSLIHYHKCSRHD